MCNLLAASWWATMACICVCMCCSEVWVGRCCECWPQNSTRGHTNNMLLMLNPHVKYSRSSSSISNNKNETNRIVSHRSENQKRERVYAADWKIRAEEKIYTHTHTKCAQETNYFISLCSYISSICLLAFLLKHRHTHMFSLSYSDTFYTRNGWMFLFHSVLVEFCMPT